MAFISICKKYKGRGGSKVKLILIPSVSWRNTLKVRNCLRKHITSEAPPVKQGLRVKIRSKVLFMRTQKDLGHCFLNSQLDKRFLIIRRTRRLSVRRVKKRPFKNIKGIVPWQCDLQTKLERGQS